uniref:Uncharacterized protein n=1 Tax=Caenorhabditis japonica TaxID=281687 RepID=A0A8R1IVE8_CAEJA
MRPEAEQLHNKVRIQTKLERTNTGSVSPPAPLNVDSNNGRQIFFEKMRTTYAKEVSISEWELEHKIAQLWDALTLSQRNAFIRTNGAEDSKSHTDASRTRNKKAKSFVNKDTKTVIKRQTSVSGRQVNCKEIAKVLDLRPESSEHISTFKKSLSSAENIKGKISAYAAQSSLISQKLLPVNENKLPCVFPTTSVSNVPPEQTEVPLKKPLLDFSFRNATRPTATPTQIVKKTHSQNNRLLEIPSLRNKSSYAEACDKYYRILSQTFLFNTGLFFGRW